MTRHRQLRPYGLQTAVLAALVRGLGLHERVMIGTIHRFQGSERPAVVCDLVDGPPLRTPGLLLRGPAGTRLLTVATSRAKGKLVVLAGRSLLEAPGPAAALFGGLTPRPEPAGSWTLAGSGTTLEWFADLAEALDDLERDAAAARAAWLPADAPARLLAAVRRPDVHGAPRGSAIVIADEVVWILGRTPARSWAAAWIVGRAVVRAVWSNLVGAPLRGR